VMAVCSGRTAGGSWGYSGPWSNRRDRLRSERERLGPLCQRPSVHCDAIPRHTLTVPRQTKARLAQPDTAHIQYLRIVS
jgi:hypothetical protein